MGYVENYGIVAPKGLRQLVEILEVLGWRREENALADGLNCHPLVIPLACWDDGTVIGLLRWPKASLNLDAPLVLSKPKGDIELLALKVDDYVLKMAAEADYEKVDGAGEILEIANKGEKSFIEV